MRMKLQESKDVFFWLAFISGLTIMGSQIIQFFVPQIVLEPAMLIVYAVTLPSYVLVKEVVRWRGYKQVQERLGEIFVLLWVGLVLTEGLILLAGQLANLTELSQLQLPWEIPQETIGITIEVLIVYSIGAASKQLYRRGS